MELKTIKELYDKVKSGEIDESQLNITLDNDNTTFFIDDGKEEEDDYLDYDSKDIKIAEANGYYDIEPLYKLLFPKAQVNWC